jgi:putative transposase
LKYRPEWPSSGFISLEAARNWVQTFVSWYNNKHRHNKIDFVTPVQRQRGKDKVILSSRELVLEKAKKANPLRWSREVRNCQPARPVSLNLEKESINSEQQNVA